MINKVLIAAAGTATRYGSDKCRLVVGTENLVERTVRLLRAHQLEPTVCVRPNTRPYYANAPHVDAVLGDRDVDKFLGSEPYWSTGRTTILFGDVWFSEQAITLIAIDPAPHHIVWYGRPTPSAITGKPWGELFGVTFRPGVFAAACRAVRYAHEQGAEHCRGWEVKEHIHRTSPAVQTMIRIDDATEDFDTPEDFDRWKSLVR